MPAAGAVASDEAEAAVEEAGAEEVVAAASVEDGSSSATYQKAKCKQLTTKQHQKRTSAYFRREQKQCSDQRTRLGIIR
jgi:hypothetical protein